MLFIGNFVYLTDQAEVLESDRRHGEFNLIMEAATGEQALQTFKQRIIRFRESSDLFQGECRIYLIQFLEFDKLPANDAAMISYKSVAGDPSMPFIDCLLPTDQGDWCRIFDWKDNRPEIDGADESVFLEFKDDVLIPGGSDA